MEKHDDLVDILTEFEEETGQQEYEQGVRLIKSNKPEEAIDLLRESVKKWGFNADRWAWLSFACVKLAFKENSNSLSPLFSEALVSAERAKRLYKAQFESSEGEDNFFTNPLYALTLYVIAMVHLGAYRDKGVALKYYKDLQKINLRIATKLHDNIFNK